MLSSCSDQGIIWLGGIVHVILICTELLLIAQLARGFFLRRLPQMLLPGNGAALVTVNCLSAGHATWFACGTHKPTKAQMLCDKTMVRRMSSNQERDRTICHKPNAQPEDLRTCETYPISVEPDTFLNGFFARS